MKMGCFGKQLLFMAPLRHPIGFWLCLWLLGVWGCRCCHFLFTSSIHVTKFKRRQRHSLTSLVREGALPREGIMQPLGKQSAVQGHQTTRTCLCNVVKLLLHAG